MNKADSGLPAGPHAEVDIREVIREQFAAGHGVLQLQPGMTDATLLMLIKLAVSGSKGKAFTVIPPREPTTGTGNISGSNSADREVPNGF